MDKQSESDRVRTLSLQKIVGSYMQKVSGLEEHCERCLKFVENGRIKSLKELLERM